MRLHHAAVLTLLIAAPLRVTAQGSLGSYEDRVAIEDVMARYVWTVDSLDPEGYVAVFTEDAVIDSNGSISKGHEEIRKIVTSLIQRRDDNKAKGLPTSNLYHVDQQRAHHVPDTQRGFAPVVLADRASRQGRQDDRGRNGPLRRPARQAQWQVVDSVAQADRLHRLIRPWAKFWRVEVIGFAIGESRWGRHTSLAFTSEGRPPKRRRWTGERTFPRASAGKPVSADC